MHHCRRYDYSTRRDEYDTDMLDSLCKGIHQLTGIEPRMAEEDNGELLGLKRWRIYWP